MKTVMTNFLKFTSLKKYTQKFFALLLLFIALSFGKGLSAATYYFVGTNTSVKSNSRDQLGVIGNWATDAAGTAYLSGGTALDTLHNWIVAKDAIIKANPGLTCKGNLTINPGITLGMYNNRDLTVTGLVTINGSLEMLGNGQSYITVLTTGQIINNGLLSIGSGNLGIYGNVTNTANATIATGASATIYSTGSLVNSGTLTVNGALSIASGGTLASTGVISGTTTISYPALVVSTNKTVPNGATYSGITFSGGSTLTAQGNLTTTTLNMTNGNLVLGDTLTISSAISGMSASNYITSDGSASLNFTGTSTGSVYVDQTTSGTSNSFNSITVNTSGTITLANATQVNGIVTPTAGTLASGGNLTLTSSSSTSYAQIAPGTSGTITGDITMQMGSSNTNAGWRPIALPLTGTIANLSGINRVYSGTTPTNTINTYRWDATQNGTSGNNNGWTAASSTDNQNNAFLIYANNNSGGLHTYSGTLSMTGTNTTGNKAFNLYSYIDPVSSGMDATGWNFIPNPYPSNLNITALLASGNFSPTYKSVHVYDYINDQYQVYSNSGVTIVNYNNSGTDGTIKNLSPFVGFWVKSGSDQTITLTNSERTTNTSNVATLLKKPYDLLRLDVFDANNKWDQCVIYLKDDATVGFDNQGDAYKLDGMNGAPALSTLINQSRAAINALPTGFDSYTVPLSYKSPTKGQTKLSLNISELGDEWTVELEDKLLGKTHNFKDGDYLFTNDASSDMRFVIHLKRNPTTGLSVLPETASFRLFQDFTSVQIDAGVQGGLIEVSVYAINGQLLESATVQSSGIQTLTLTSLQNSGIYIIKAQVGAESQQIKVVR